MIVSKTIIMAQMYSAIWQYRRRDLFLLRTPDLGSENNTWHMNMYVNVYLKYTRLNTCFCFISFLRICGGKHRPIQIFSHIFSLRRSGTLPVFSVCPAMFARQTFKSCLNYNMLINKLNVLTTMNTVCLYTPLPFVHQLTNRPTHTVMITPRALNHKQEIPQNLSSPSLKFKKQEVF